MRFQECPQNLLVRRFGERHAVEVVLLHELVEDVGAEDDGLRYAHRHVLKGVHVRVAFDDVVEECDAAPLAAQRAVADAGEVAEVVEALAVEDRHHALVLHPAVGDDGVVDDFAVLIDILQRLPCYFLQELRYREESP